MLKKILVVLISVIVLFSAGCPKYRPKFKITQKTIDVIEQKYKTEVLRYNCLGRGFHYNDVAAPTLVLCLDGNNGTIATANATGKDDAKIIRNRIIEAVVASMNDLFEDFVIDLQVRRSSSNILADITELGLGTAIGITNGERAIQVLGVIFTAFKGGRRSIDLNFYYQQSTPIIIAKMNALRDPILTSILQKKELDVDSYKLITAERELVDYFFAGSLVKAFTALAGDTSLQAQQARIDLLRVQNAQITPNVSVVLAKSQAEIFSELSIIEQDVRSSDTDINDRAEARLVKIYNDLKKASKFDAVFAILKIGTKCQQGVDQNQIIMDYEAGSAVTIDELYFIIRGVNCAIENDTELTLLFEKIIKTK